MVVKMLSEINEIPKCTKWRKESYEISHLGIYHLVPLPFNDPWMEYPQSVF